MDAGTTAVVLVVDGVEVVVGRLGALPPDLGVVDALARLQLVAMRQGCSIRLRDVGDDLAGLLELVGLTGLIAGDPGGRGRSGLEAGGQAEGLEELRVEEVVEPDDPSV